LIAIAYIIVTLNYSEDETLINFVYPSIFLTAGILAGKYVIKCSRRTLYLFTAALSFCIVILFFQVGDASGNILAANQQAHASQVSGDKPGRAQKKAIIKLLKLVKAPAGEKGKRILLIILLIILAVALITLISALACSLACAGNGALAIIVLGAGITGVFFLEKAIVRWVENHRKKKTQKESTENQ
jgi:hypothetical protein